MKGQGQKKYYFHFPSLFLTALMFLSFVAFMSLGFWQLARYKEKVQIKSLLHEQLQRKPISLTKLSSFESKRQFLPVQFQGYFINQKQFLLDNKIYRHQVGYDVITPVKIYGQTKLVLVNRGWIEGNKRRTELPNLPKVTDLQFIQGIIFYPRKNGLLLNAEKNITGRWPKRLQQINFTQIERILKEPVFHFIVFLNANSSQGFIREWQFVNTIPEKHIGYALQWFIFAMLSVIIFVGVGIKT